MEKKNYGISLLLAAYSFAQLVFAAIVLCNGTTISDSNLFVSIVVIVTIAISVVFALLSKCAYQKIIKTEQEADINNKIEKLKLEKENLEKQLREATADKTDERNSLKMLREHEERMAIIKALGANYDKQNADAIQSKLNEIIKTLDTIKQS